MGTVITQLPTLKWAGWLLAVLTFEERLEDCRLKDFDDLQLSSSLHLEPLELGETFVKVKDGVALLQFLALLLGGGQYHGEVGSVYLEED